MEKSRTGKRVPSWFSIIDDGGITFENFFGFAVEFSGYFMNLVFLAAGGAAHAYPSALAMDFKFA